MAKRSYSDVERAEAVTAVAANGGNVYLTAGQLGIPPKTLEHWVKGERHPEAAQMGQQKKGELAGAFRNIAFLMVGVAERKAHQLDARSAMVAAAIATDKAQLLHGAPTSITDLTTKGEAIDRHSLTAADLAASARLVAEAGLGVPAHGGGQPVDTPPAEAPP
jgi:transposase-like protein